MNDRSRSFGLNTGLWLMLIVCAACETEYHRPAVDHFSWINPITAVVVALPEGWRHCPDTAARGTTTVGFFAPNYARLMSRHGHITLHHEYIYEPSAPMILERFVDSFSGYIRHRGRIESGPVFSTTNGIRTAHMSVATLHRRREIVLKVQFWTTDERDFWYAVIESDAEDARFRDMALPLVQQLKRSTVPR